MTLTWKSLGWDSSVRSSKSPTGWGFKYNDVIEICLGLYEKDVRIYEITKVFLMNISSTLMFRWQGRWWCWRWTSTVPTGPTCWKRSNWWTSWSIPTYWGALYLSQWSALEVDPSQIWIPFRKISVQGDLWKRFVILWVMVLMKKIWNMSLKVVHKYSYCQIWGCVCTWGSTPCSHRIHWGKNVLQMYQIYRGENVLYQIYWGDSISTM